MTKKQLEQYRFIEKRIASIQKKIDRCEANRPGVISGKVKGSSARFPYSPIFQTVSAPEGHDNYKKWSERLKNHYQELKYAKQALEMTWLKIDEFIESIPDESTKLIFTYSFIEGMDQQKIADKLGFEQSTISKRISLYLERSNDGN